MNSWLVDFGTELGAYHVMLYPHSSSKWVLASSSFYSWGSEKQLAEDGRDYKRQNWLSNPGLSYFVRFVLFLLLRAFFRQRFIPKVITTGELGVC